MASARITHDVIDTSALLAEVSSPAHGAIALFIGTVREQNDGRAVSGMKYDAYEAMALDVLRAIVIEAEEKIEDGRICAVHRIGDLAIGDVSVAIAVGTPHRADAFDAARYVIEEIKRRLPVWKEEHYIGGEARWLDGTVPPMPADATRVSAETRGRS